MGLHAFVHDSSSQIVLNGSYVEAVRIYEILSHSMVRSSISTEPIYHGMEGQCLTWFWLSVVELRIKQFTKRKFGKMDCSDC